MRMHRDILPYSFAMPLSEHVLYAGTDTGTVGRCVSIDEWTKKTRRQLVHGIASGRLDRIVLLYLQHIRQLR